MKKFSAAFRVLILIIILIAPTASISQSFAWAKRAGLWAYDLGFGIGTDNAGNVYISGKYEQNGASFGHVTVPCVGNHDIFIAKYSSSGSFQWVRTAGSYSGDYAHCLAVDGAGNAYISGEFEGTCNFGSGVSLKSNGDNDVFVAKYNTNGSLVWARKLGGGGLSDKTFGICVSGSAVYLTGKFEGTANFQGITLSTSGGKEMFLAKYTTDGVFQWVKKGGGSGSDEGYSVSTDPAGNVYVTGSFSGSANFSGQVLSSKGSKDIFIAKYNSAGSILWVKKAGGYSSDIGYGIKVDNSYRVFLTGSFRGTCSFGSINLSSSGQQDVFIARYDMNGNAIWAKKAGGYGEDIGRGIAVDNSANVYITGGCGNNAVFGNKTLSGSDGEEIYFASYDQSGNFRWALKAGGAADETPSGNDVEMGRGIAVDPWGGVVGTGSYRKATSFGGTTLNPWTNTDVYVTKIVQGSGSGKAGKAPIIFPLDSVAFCSGGSTILKSQVDSGQAFVWLKDGNIISEQNQNDLKVSSPGVYSIRVVDGSDTIQSAPTKVIVTNKIEAGLTALKSEFCRDSNNVLKASEGEGYIYRWKRDGRFIKDAGKSTYTPDRSGNYQVQIVQGSCFDWSPVMKVDLKTCAVDSMVSKNVSSFDMKEDSTVINIYPNPNNGLFTLELNMAQDNSVSDDVKVEVVNTIGQVVYSQTVKIQKGYLRHHVELGSAVIPGMYVLRLVVGEETEKNRLMLIR